MGGKRGNVDFQLKNITNQKQTINETRENQRFSVNKETSKKFPVSQKSQSDFSGSRKSTISVKSILKK